MSPATPVVVDDGETRFDGTLRGEALDGPAKVSRQGQPVADMHYAGGVLSGPCTIWGPQRRPLAQLNYREGRLHGQARHFDPEGRLQRETQYRDGLLHGEARTYHPTGPLSEEARYLGGLLHGELRRFHANGRLALREQYAKGQPVAGTRSAYDDKGRLLDASGKPVPFWRRKRSPDAG